MLADLLAESVVDWCRSLMEQIIRGGSKEHSDGFAACDAGLDQRGSFAGWDHPPSCELHQGRNVSCHFLLLDLSILYFADKVGEEVLTVRPFLEATASLASAGIHDNGQVPTTL